MFAKVKTTHKAAVHSPTDFLPRNEWVHLRISLSNPQKLHCFRREKREKEVENIETVQGDVYSARYAALTVQSQEGRGAIVVEEEDSSSTAEKC